MIYNKRLTADDQERLAVRCEALGMGRPTVSHKGLLFSGERARMLHEKIAPYVHPSLDYKLHPDYRGRFAWHPDISDAHLNGTRLQSRTGLRPRRSKVLRKHRKPAPPSQHERPSKRHRYDLQVESNHTYLVDHVVVHNSPETQPGGRALKFYASQRLDIRRIETLKDGTEAVGNRVRVKVVKNKLAAPFRQAEFDIEFGKGISSSGCLIDLGIEDNIVTKSGSFFSYGNERLGQGRGNAKAYLDEHPAMASEIRAKIFAARGISPEGPAAPLEPVAEAPVKAVGSEAPPEVAPAPVPASRREPVAA